MKAISIRQPWATLIATGEKTLELRSWKTRYRGPLLICAGKTPDDIYFEFDPEEAAENLPLGVAVATVELVDVRPFDAKKDSEAAFYEGDPSEPDPEFAWVLENPVMFEKPFHVKGKQGLFEVDFPQGSEENIT